MLSLQVGVVHLLSRNSVHLQHMHTLHFHCDVTEHVQIFYDCISYIIGPMA